MSVPDRNITMNIGWPREATPCALVPNWAGEFVSFADWVNFAEKRLARSRNSNGEPLTAICVDTLGRRCANGRDFMRARDEGAFPVRFFFECVESAALASAQAENERLREALKKTYAALKAVVGMLREHPAMQGREHVDLGIQANAALNQSERVLAALSNTDGGEG